MATEMQMAKEKIARLEAALRLVVHNADHSPMGRVLGGIAKDALQVEVGFDACRETALIGLLQQIKK